MALDRDAELFLVAGAGAIGRGDQVADRVPPLLVTDGELTRRSRRSGLPSSPESTGTPVEILRWIERPGHGLRARCPSGVTGG